MLQLKATISCERKLVFETIPKPSPTKAFTVKSGPATSTPVQIRQTQLDTLIADLQDDNVEYTLKQEVSDSGQILEVYEISNIEDAEIEYADENTDEISEVEERYGK